MTRQLSVKQERFIQEYCANGGNGTEAARKAGYTGDDNALGVMAHDNLKKPKIRDAIETFRAKTAERAEVTVESLSRQLQDIAEGAAEKQPAAAVSALSTIAKLHGLLTEDRKNERSPLKDVLGRIERENGSKPRLVAVK